MRRKRKQPDKRLDWRDPNMPVLRPAMAPGDTEYKPYEFRPDWIQKYHQNAMSSPRMEPMWKDDPSYWWSKKYRAHPIASSSYLGETGSRATAIGSAQDWVGEPS